MNEYTTGHTFENVILDSLKHFIQKEAERILSEHLKQIEVELTKNVTDQVSKTVLTIFKMVSFDRFGTSLKITVEDYRDQKTLDSSKGKV